MGPFFFLCHTTCVQGLLSWEDLVALKRAVVFFVFFFDALDQLSHGQEVVVVRPVVLVEVTWPGQEPSKMPPKLVSQEMPPIVIHLEKERQ